MQLLLVKDDTVLSEAICDGVRQNGWDIDLVSDAKTARAALINHTYSSVVLDIDLPGDSGLSVLRFLRTRYDPTPVLLLTAKGQLSERILGLDAGADDYLVKPFQFDELWAHVRSLIRRSHGRVIRMFSYGNVRIDRARQIVTKAGVDVVLSPHEYLTLLALIERPGHIVTRKHLQAIVYGATSTIESNTIAVFIHQLRRKLGEDLIRTVHGQGYVIRQPKR